MSSKSTAVKKRFHEACARAVDTQFGPGWVKVEFGPESWTACFHKCTKIATRVLSLRLADRHHVVHILLAIKHGPDDPMPRVWWEDRERYPNQSAYAKVLWSGETYASELCIAVPRNVWSVEFSTVIEEQLTTLRPAIDHWHTEAEAYVSRVLAK